MIFIQTFISLFVTLLIAYILGSIPFGVIVSTIYRIDITKMGSGNIGATNVLRVLGIIPAIVVFFLDFLKGFLSILLAKAIFINPVFIVLTGVSAILGHMFSIFLKFKGGRGAATGLGVLLGITPDVFFVAILLATIIIGLTRYVSLASITVPFVCVGLMLYWGKPIPYAVATTIAAILIVIKHIPNIQRLISGTERRIGDKV